VALGAPRRTPCRARAARCAARERRVGSARTHTRAAAGGARVCGHHAARTVSQATPWCRRACAARRLASLHSRCGGCCARRQARKPGVTRAMVTIMAAARQPLHLLPRAALPDVRCIGCHGAQHALCVAAHAASVYLHVRRAAEAAARGVSHRCQLSGVWCADAMDGWPAPKATPRPSARCSEHTPGQRRGDVGRVSGHTTGRHRCQAPQRARMGAARR
jgi:hypothetical protein